MPTDEEINAGIETNSNRYGHDKTPQDVFEDRLRPQAYELIDAFAASEHLSKKEAIAFVQQHLVSTPTRVELEGESEEFDSPAELKSYALPRRMVRSSRPQCTPPFGTHSAHASALFDSVTSVPDPFYFHRNQIPSIFISIFKAAQIR